MDNVTERYRALLAAAQELLQAQAYMVNGIPVDKNDMRRRRMNLEEATRAFADACEASPAENAQVHQLALV